ncbi:UDP-N-acetylglucosamine--N-acetylmuramyl-(pentapeptide) pyrophosphoryl-undecaprenol N-acetylglucosamine transferase [Treponema sp. OMZ 840]|uniref:UDP-N-acetylglucosamine--N-acetylmuramyl- (pentapeptide) pyrophosphoryl-undecaprenol N-acetylglucosamine transferase n=1 Tax=Treponema sp. OMZ 840 TaxID=244313 RepID=UPI003D943BFE
MKTIVCTGGGTGGHIYPGLAVADELKELCPDVRIVWFGSSSGRDKEMVLANKNAAGFSSVDAFVGIPSGKLRRYFSFRTFADVFKVAAGFFTAFFHLARIKPCAVFSKGGFVSVPPCAAAFFLRIPVYTHECDFSPGLATRLNSRFASCILLSYEQSRRFFPEKMQPFLSVTGNPVRSAFYTADAVKGRLFLGLDRKSESEADKTETNESVKKSRAEEKPLLLVLGGSSGAHQINNLVFKNFDWLCERFILVHQTGRGNDYERALCPEYESARQNKNYLPYDFIYSDMPHVIAASDIVFSRSGANSLWECAVCAKPMLLLPLAGSGTRGDQVENAARFAQQGAALVIQPLTAGAPAGKASSAEEKLSLDLKSNLKKMCDVDFRTAMGKNALKSAGTEKSAQKIADILYRGVLAKNDF